MLTINIDYFKLKPGELPKATILLDNGYHPQKIQKELEKIYPEIMKKIKDERLLHGGPVVGFGF